MSSQEMYRYLERLFPICRSLTGKGVRETFAILQEIAPLNLTEVPSGTKVFDWIVPPEWNVRDAYVADSSGRHVIDFKRHNLHLMGYSMPFEGNVSIEELQKHLYSLPELPGVIPYVTSYYQQRWGFCLSDQQRQELKDPFYQVKVDSTLEPGSMTMGDLVIPGDTKDEVFFSTYICHPSMANNELSGPIVAAFLAKELLSRPKRRYTYRFAFVPETIGAIAYLSKHLHHLRKHVKAGYVITCVGDPGPYSYLETRLGDTLSDRVAQHVLDHIDGDTRWYSWLQRGSDERQYGWPGVDLPMGSLMRTKYGEYPEYHTSADDLDFVRPKALGQSLDMYLKAIDVLENNRIYRCTTLCEPQMGRRGLYPTVSTRTSGLSARELVDILAYSDGKTDLLDIADRLHKPVWECKESIHKLIEAALLISD